MLVEKVTKESSGTTSDGMINARRDSHCRTAYSCNQLQIDALVFMREVIFMRWLIVVSLLFSRPCIPLK